MLFANFLITNIKLLILGLRLSQAGVNLVENQYSVLNRRQSSRIDINYKSSFLVLNFLLSK